MNENILVRDLCKEFTQDIEDVADKRWLIPALVSHVCYYYKQRISEDTVTEMVREWWPNHESV